MPFYFFPFHHLVFRWPLSEAVCSEDSAHARARFCALGACAGGNSSQSGLAFAGPWPLAVSLICLCHAALWVQWGPAEDGPDLPFGVLLEQGAPQLHIMLME